MPAEERVIQVTAVDGRAQVHLPETPGGGYVWEIAERPTQRRVFDERYVEERGERVAGGHGEHIFVLEVETVGRWEAVFWLRRPWQQDALEERRVVVHSR